MTRNACVAAIVAALALSTACATDPVREYDVVASVFPILPDPGAEDTSPTVNADGTVIAWVRPIPDTVAVQQVLVMRGLRQPPDTALTLRDEPEVAIDLSPRGDQIIVLTFNHGVFPLHASADGDWSDGPRRRLDLYSGLRTPRWVDESSFLFGALGPEGSGVYRYFFHGDSVAPVAVTSNWFDGRWTGTYGDLDRGEIRVCMERIANPNDLYTREVIVVDRSTGKVDLEISGRIPSFWSVLSDEGDAIVYVDEANRLWARRWGGEMIYVAGYVKEYDISDDGRWIFSLSAWLGSPALVLYSIREPR